jgi:nucleoside-diphosphate-sugar epimerase
MQTILGSTGAIGTGLAKVLPGYTKEIRLVSRNPKKINPADTLFPADLSDRDQVMKAVEGSEIVFLTVGLDYSTKVWKQHWPPLMKNVIDACLQNGSRLVFFDNVYAIGGDNVKHITETSPVSPASKKGVIRREVEKMITEDVEKRNLSAIIARAPDFISEFIETSVLMNLVYKNLAKGKKAQWFCNAKVIHSFGYTPDLAKGTAMLGNAKDTFNQVWNLPTDPKTLTGEQWIGLFAKEMGKPGKYQVIPGWAVKAIGLFVPIMNELHEMLYQFDRDYFFDSSKFNRHFSFTPTTNEMAVKETVHLLA